jgi:hypothetical protein
MYETFFKKMQAAEENSAIDQLGYHCQQKKSKLSTRRKKEVIHFSVDLNVWNGVFSPIILSMLCLNLSILSSYGSKAVIA